VRAGELLRARGLKLAIAESCTGGLLMHRMTDVPGSSLYLLGGVVAYADQVKSGILGVDAPTIVQHGAVSEPVAAQLAQGVRRVLGADIGIGITGIAGPGGGTVEKPVGLTYLGIATPDGNVKVIERVWDGDRSQNKRSSTDAALELLIAYLER
jgi:PncC family amidohydrolase